MILRPNPPAKTADTLLLKTESAPARRSKRQAAIGAAFDYLREHKLPVPATEHFVSMPAAAVRRSGGGLSSVVYCRSLHWSSGNTFMDHPSGKGIIKIWATSYTLMATDLGLVHEGASPKERRAVLRRLKLAVDSLVRTGLVTIHECPPIFRLEHVRNQFAIAPVRDYDAGDLDVSPVACNAVRLDLLALGENEALMLAHLMWRRAIGEPDAPVGMGRKKAAHQTGLTVNQARQALQALAKQKAVYKQRRTEDIRQPRPWVIDHHLAWAFPPDAKAVKRHLQAREERRQQAAYSRQKRQERRQWSKSRISPT